jgi:hypothetical protein
MADFGVDLHFLSFLTLHTARWHAAAIALSCLLVT